MNNPNEFPAYDEPLNVNTGPDAPETMSHEPPPVLMWYKLYAGVMAFLQLAGAASGIALLKYLPVIMANAPGVSETELKIRAVIICVVGSILFVAYVVALVLPKSPGAWIYHLVMIGIGLSSCCLWPATIPLMIAWLKPGTQRWFGRAVPGVLPPSNPNAPPPPIPSV
jgi:hypothetical protein